MAADDIERRVIDAIRGGGAVLLPTDTVYGLCGAARHEGPALRIADLKGRKGTQPTALLASGLDVLFEWVPELDGRAATVAAALLPGPYTLVLPNPACRFPWLTGRRPDTIGVRVAELPPAAQRVLDAVGCVLATSANDHGGPAPATLDDVPARIRAACAAELDVGALPGVASTVIDFTGPEPEVIREGAASATEAIERVRAALAA
jgi:tRNA threonylcarbamoyl adenosine modification protein (Sua5/YciO/YrdC/YwlC family)